MKISQRTGCDERSEKYCNTMKSYTFNVLIPGIPVQIFFGNVESGDSNTVARDIAAPERFTRTIHQRRSGSI